MRRESLLYSFFGELSYRRTKDALRLIALSLWPNYSHYMLESPSIKFAYDIFNTLNYKIKTIAVDQEGLNAKLLEPYSESIIYTSSAHQFPMGSTLSISRRQALLDYATSGNHIILEDDYDWDFCQIQLNYLDENYQAGLNGKHDANDKGIGVFVMEPLRGGMLAKTELPADIEQIWKSTNIDRRPAQLALKYLWNFEAIGIVLSKAEISAINDIKKIFTERTIVNCTNCRYCMPCPQGVNIPENIWAYNHASIFDDHGKADFWINDWLEDHQKPSNCIECGLCQTKCPQNIEIMKTV